MAEHNTSFEYDDEMREWLESFSDETERSLGGAVRYCIRQQMEREKVEE